MHNYDIIIPHYAASEEVQTLARRCLESIREHSSDYRLIFVDNGGGEPLMDELDKHDCVVISPGTNLGFVKAVNAGIKISTAPFVVVMNNDTEAAHLWLEKLSAPLVWKSGISGPKTTTKESWQGNVPEGFAEFHTLSRKSMLAFFCAMFRRDVFEKVGLLDEDFGWGFGDDDNYCERVHRAGFELVLVTSLTIPHHHRTTFKQMFGAEKIKEMQDRAIQLHYDKMAKMGPSPEDQTRVLHITRTDL